jgi:hypothetical protein
MSEKKKQQSDNNATKQKTKNIPKPNPGKNVPRIGPKLSALLSISRPGLGRFKK